MTKEVTHKIDTRRHDLDALRAAAMLLGIVYHAALSFAAGFTWLVEDRMQSTWAFVFQAFVHGFRMPLFFLISGFFTAMLWRKKGLKALLWQRFVRVFIPCMVGLITIVPAMNWAAGIALRGNAPVVEESSESSLWSALKAGDVEAARVHVEGGADVRSLHPTFFVPPLTWATFFDQAESVEFLLKHGADVNAASPDGETSLHTAAFFGRPEIVELLIAHGAPIDAKNNKGETPLHHAQLDIGVVRFFADLIGIPMNAVETQKKRSAISERLKQLGAREPETVAVETTQRSIAGLLQQMMYQNVFVLTWFLWFLCLFVVVFVAYAGLWDWVPWQAKPSFILSRGNVLWLAALTVLPQWFMGRSSSEFGPDTSMGIVPLPHVFAYYLIFFAFGVLYFDCHDDEAKLGSSWRWGLPIGLLVLLPLGLEFRSGVFGFRSLLLKPEHYEWGAIVMQALYVWTMSFGCMGMFRSLLTRENRAIRYLSDSAYWLYLSHLPLVILAQHWVKEWQIPGSIKLLGIFVATTFLLLIAYDLLVRYTWIGLVLNGRRRRKLVQIAEKANPVVSA